MSEKCRKHNNNSNNPLTSRRTDGGKKAPEKHLFLQRIYQLETLLPEPLINKRGWVEKMFSFSL